MESKKRKDLQVPDYAKPLMPKRVSVRVRPPPKCAPCAVCLCVCADTECECCDLSCVAPVPFYFSK
jgi:hypothetical protein